MKSMLERTNGRRTTQEPDNDVALARLEAGLEQQRQEMARMMAELTRMQQSMHAPPPQPATPDDDLEAILQDNERLREQVRELQRQLSAVPPDDSAKLREENAVLRQLLDVQQNAPPARSADDQEEIATLNRLLQEKEAEIAKLQKTPGPMRETDLESYESELNQFRQQLEQDRAKLNKEIEQLRLRNAELDEATREMEMEMSRERAELGRERQRLDRLREDVRLEMERIQREGGVRESLANVHKLREEMNKKQGNPLNDKLKNLRNQLSE
jgi:chromosome segregation ATPase